jgi:glyoxylase-like metal-dependent hydrolase (beta-lactamase superfamily II)
MPFDRVSFVNAGHCTQLGYFAGSARPGPVKFHSVLLLLEHARHGASLIDTGYGPWFFEATRKFPAKLYRWTLPVHLPPQGDASAILAQRGVTSVREIFISHFHGDHVAGLRHFPQSTYVYRGQALATLSAQSPSRQTFHGFLPMLLPDDFAARGRAIDEWQFAPGRDELGGELRDFRVHDYFGDGELLLVDLPGHAPGHTGFAFRTATERFLYVADACWDMDALLRGRSLPFASRLLQHSPSTYEATQRKLRDFAALHPHWRVLACHCPRTQTHVDRHED